MIASARLRARREPKDHGLRGTFGTHGSDSLAGFVSATARDGFLDPNLHLDLWLFSIAGAIFGMSWIRPEGEAGTARD